MRGSSFKNILDITQKEAKKELLDTRAAADFEQRKKNMKVETRQQYILKGYLIYQV